MKNKNKKSKKKKSSVLRIAFIAILAVSLSGALAFFLAPSKKEPAILYTEPIPQLQKPIRIPVDDIIVELPESTKTAPKEKLPKVGIIIDDIGHRKKIAQDIIALGLNISYSILPQSPYAKTLAELISSNGNDLLLHLPLEASDPKWDPGPGALMLSMSPATMRTKLTENLDGFAFIGINNHMGSKFTSAPDAMLTLLQAVKEKDLFFIDSLTSSQSIAYSTARKLGIKTARRNVFLDNDQNTDAIIKQLRSLISHAQKKGFAIGIGHPYPATLQALQSAKKELLKKVQLVGIHELVN